MGNVWDVWNGTFGKRCRTEYNILLIINMGTPELLFLSLYQSIAQFKFIDVYEREVKLHKTKSKC